jgi:hypothetical protein
MRICLRFGAVLLIVIGILRVRPPVAEESSSAQQDRFAIERLHQRDVEATLSGKAESVCCKPEIKDLQIAGDWVFEWGAISHTSNLRR